MTDFQTHYKLYLGDCLEILKSFSDNSIDAVITDPPYGIGENWRKNMSRGKVVAPIDYGKYEWDIPITELHISEIM